MRLRRAAGAAKPFSFGARGLLGAAAVTALAAWWGAWAVLIAAAVTTAHYVVLCGAAALVARAGDQRHEKAFHRWQFVACDDGTTLRIIATVYLVLHYARHLFWLMVLAPGGHAAIWHAPVSGPLTLAQLEHLIVAALSLLLIVSFVARAYAGDRFSRRICIETSTLLTFLLATHFAIP